MSTQKIMLQILFGLFILYATGNCKSAISKKFLNFKHRYPAFKRFQLVVITDANPTTESKTSSTTHRLPRNIWGTLGVLQKPTAAAAKDATNSSSSNSQWGSELLRPVATKNNNTKDTNTPTTTAATTTKAAIATSKSIVSAKLSKHCNFVCQKNKYTKKYAYTCQAFKKIGKYSLCYFCRYRRRVCQEGVIVGLFN